MAAHDFEPADLSPYLSAEDRASRRLREVTLETALRDLIRDRFAHLTIYRQHKGWGRGIPDLMAFWGPDIVTIIELKAQVAGDSAVAQLRRYMLHAWGVSDELQVMGVLAAPRFRITNRPRWLALWPLRWSQ